MLIVTFSSWACLQYGKPYAPQFDIYTWVTCHVDAQANLTSWNRTVLPHITSRRVKSFGPHQTRKWSIFQHWQELALELQESAFLLNPELEQSCHCHGVFFEQSLSLDQSHQSEMWQPWLLSMPWYGKKKFWNKKNVRKACFWMYQSHMYRMWPGPPWRVIFAMSYSQDWMCSKIKFMLEAISTHWLLMVSIS